MTTERVTKLAKAVLVGLISAEEAIEVLVREGMDRQDAEKAING